MKEYIERDAAIESIMGLTIVGPAVAQYANAVCYNLQNLPAANVAEVRHGRWERNSPDDIVVYCSQCMMPQDASSNYCPSCGARMDKEDEHEVG